MTRAEQLEYCKVCTNRQMDLQKGLLCSLTNDFADFEDTCADFNEDVDERAQLLARELQRAGHQDAGTSLDYKKNKEKGAAVFMVGLILLLILISVLPSIIFMLISISVMIWGGRMYMRGVEQEAILKKQQEFEEEKN